MGKLISVIESLFETSGLLLFYKIWRNLCFLSYPSLSELCPDGLTDWCWTDCIQSDRRLDILVSNIHPGASLSWGKWVNIANVSNLVVRCLMTNEYQNFWSNVEVVRCLLTNEYQDFWSNVEVVRCLLTNEYRRSALSILITTNVC